MTGKEFHAGFAIDERGITAIRTLMRVSHTHIYHLFRQKEVPEKFVLRAKSFGVKFPSEEISELKSRITELEKQLRILHGHKNLKKA